ncbi:hypothetical protein ABGT15_06130 [Flavobacterium enshiense]|uniref:hypothetical protein n=1 Tax=Flavobacterium enshiense TaxID=1341165 RepID=UPI00345CA3DF
MKKFFGLLVCAMLLSSCDDGDLVLESFNFDAATIQKCTDKEVLFKINGGELLLLDIPASNFPNEATPVDTPRIVTISGSNRVLYRKYNGTITNNTICSVIPPANPTVINEWTAATGGTIQIISTEKTTIDPVTSEVTVTGYNHQIKFINIQFVSNDNTFVFEEYLFGTYTTDL